MNKYLIPIAMLLIAAATLAETKPQFDKIDRNHDGILNKEEVAGIISDHEFNKADQNHDGNLSKAEYLELVLLEKRSTEGEG